jgi:acyl phosphate:glycerol-3-phosphate acyltransferase
MKGGEGHQMEYAPAIIMGYLLGSIPVSLLVARHYGVDLYQTADGNPGAWNALEQLGPRRAAPAFLGDAAKAFAAGMIGHALGDWWVAFAAVAAAMVGHGLPVFAHFRGGKAVMAFVGGGFALSPIAACAALVLCGVLTAATSFKWGARAGVFAYPAIQLAVDPVERVIATGALMCLIGALFGLAALRSRSARAKPAAGAAPPA